MSQTPRKEARASREQGGKSVLSHLSVLQLGLQSDGEEDVLERRLPHLQPAPARQALCRHNGHAHGAYTGT